MLHIDGELINDRRRGEGFIQKAVSDQLDIINALALTAMENQENHVTIDLSENFQIPYMDDKIARSRIYYNVCRDLEKRKINFRLIKPKRWCRICIKPMRSEDMTGIQCKKCGRDTFVARDAKYKILISFKSQDEDDELANIEKWLDQRSI